MPPRLAQAPLTMTSPYGAVALLVAAVSLAGAASDPFAPKVAEWEAKGFSVRERARHGADELTASVVVYAPPYGSLGDRLEFYVAVKNKAYLGFVHPGAADRLDIDPSAGRFTDLLGDGSRVIAYRETRTALGATTLNILRWKRFKVERVAVFPEGRFVRLGGEPVIVSRELPLGRYLTVDCEDFGALTRTAFKTTLHAPRGGFFVDVSAEHPEHFKAAISRKEKSLERLKGAIEKNAGEYLGLALSSYYDYAALGRARAGWERLRGFFMIPPPAPASVKSCVAAMEKELRGKMGVPADWP